MPHTEGPPYHFVVGHKVHKQVYDSYITLRDQRNDLFDAALSVVHLNEFPTRDGLLEKQAMKALAAAIAKAKKEG